MSPTAPSTCPACDETTAPGAAFCDACGASLEPARGRARGETSASRRARQEARRELARTRRRVATLRLTYRALGVTFALFLILFASWWFRLSTRGWEGTTLLLIVQIVTLASAVDAALMLACAGLLTRFPVLAGSLGAALVTVGSALMLFQVAWGQLDLLLQAVLVTRLVLNASLWALLPAALRLRRLLDEHPDLAPRRAGAATERREQERRRTRRLALGLAGAALLVLAGGWWLTRPPGLEALSRRFVAAWNDDDCARVGALFGEEQAARRTADLRRWRSRRDPAALPPIRAHRFTQRNDSRAVLLAETGPGYPDLRVRWSRRRAGWTLSAVAFQ